MKRKIMASLVALFASVQLIGCSTLPADQSTQDKNVVVVKKFLNEVVSGGHVEILDELWAQDMYWYNNGNEVRGIQNFKTNLSAVLGKTFADMKLTIYDVITSNDRVIVRFKNSGRNIGPLLGQSPTNKTASWDGIGIYRLKDGKIIEAWFAENDLAMLSQLGIIQMPQAK